MLYSPTIYINHIEIALIMSLIEAIEASRIVLDDVDLDVVKPNNPLYRCSVQGNIVEAMVNQWLSSIDGLVFDDNFPRNNENVLVENTPNDITVYSTDKSRTKHGYDFLFFYENKPYIVEVKSTKLNGFAGKIGRAFNLAKGLYDQKPEMLIFIPFCLASEIELRNISQEHPRVQFVDLGYNKDELIKNVMRFYDERSFFPWSRIPHISECQSKLGPDDNKL